MTHDAMPAYGLWGLVIINTAAFVIFAFSFTKPQTRRDWRSFGALSAFIVALFTEMYGFPLTIYLLSGWITRTYPGIDPFSHDAGHLWSTLLGLHGDPHLSVFHLLSIAAIFGGFILLSAAWNVLYKAQSRHTMATTGVYEYVRHPQYVGFIVIMLGFLLQWPTLLTLLMFPVLVVMYVRLARLEEREAIAEFGDAYRAYIWTGCQGSSRAWDRRATPTLSGALSNGAQRPGDSGPWRAPGFVKGPWRALGFNKGGHKAVLDAQILAGLHQLLSRSLGLWLTVVHRARDDRYATRHRKPWNVKFVGRRACLDPARDPRNQRHRQQDLGGARSTGARRTVSTISLDHRFYRHGAVDVEFGDLWRAAVCPCGLAPRGGPPPAESGDVADADSVWLNHYPAISQGPARFLRDRARWDTPGDRRRRTCRRALGRHPARWTWQRFWRRSR